MESEGDRLHSASSPACHRAGDKRVGYSVRQCAVGLPDAHLLAGVTDVPSPRVLKEE